MFKSFVLAPAAFALSLALSLTLCAASASANGYRQYGYYGVATPVFEYQAGAYYGYPPPSYSMTPWPIYAAAPRYVGPRVYNYAPGYPGRAGCWGRYGCW
jgi:hypothetical protein